MCHIYILFLSIVIFIDLFDIYKNDFSLLNIISCKTTRMASDIFYKYAIVFPIFLTHLHLLYI